MANTYYYSVDKDERGEFAAHVRDSEEKVIWETQGEVFEDGWMQHAHDLTGLRDYLVELGLIGLEDDLQRGN